MRKINNLHTDIKTVRTDVYQLIVNAPEHLLCEDSTLIFYIQNNCTLADTMFSWNCTLMRYYKYNKSAIFSGQCLGQDGSLILFTNRDGCAVKLCYAKSCIHVGICLIEKKYTHA